MNKRMKWLLVALCAFATQGFAQCIDITLKDNTGVTYNVNDVKSIDFFTPGPEGWLTGRWFLGYRVNGSTSTKYSGKENIVFRGSQMIWNTQTTQKVYDLEYAEDLLSFDATLTTGTTKQNYAIVAREPELLVLKRSSYTYYFYLSAEAATTTPQEEFPSRTELTDAKKIIDTYKSGVSNNPNNPMGNHIANRARRATDEEKAWLEDATKNPTKMCGFTNWVAKAVTLYPYTNPKPADVNQHAIGDCCLCAVLASLGYLYPDFIKDIIVKESTTKYLVKMYDPFGDPIDVRVDNKVLCGNDGGIAQMTGKNDKITWATILEKAIMKWETVYKCNSTNGDDIGGIGTENAAPLLTGCGNSFAIDRKKLFNLEMQKVAQWSVENGQIGIGGFGVGDLPCGTEKTVTGHAFTIMLTSYPDEYLWSMRNPWGQSSTSKKVDGKLEIPNLRSTVKVIDFRIVEPGAAKPFLRADIGPYTPPSYIRRQVDTGVSEEILRKCGVTYFVDYLDDEVVPASNEIDEE
ncbi:MAG: hypothetical protein HUK03_03750 [Bacteroidaceae bacterium]|nr:hypothetical protein [Bacteroidaceae bacterium]